MVIWNCRKKKSAVRRLFCVEGIQPSVRMSCGLQYVTLPSGRRVVGRVMHRGDGAVRTGHYCQRIVNRPITASDRHWCDKNDTGRCIRRPVQKRKPTAGRKPRRTNHWIEHVRRHVAKHNLSWKAGLREARATYKRVSKPKK